MPSPTVQTNSLLPGGTTIRLFGKVDESMFAEFIRQHGAAPDDKPLVVELSTSGGNADIGRRIAHEIRSWRKDSRDAYFLGKTFVYSAGVTIMSAFERDRRFLTSDCEVLIHERKMDKTLQLKGALRGCRSIVQDALAEIESGQRLERAGFADLVAGTRLSDDDVLAKVLERDWYLTGEQAMQEGLIAGIL
jgi:ATP-dependent protease ClpP protease subunit